MTLTAAETQAGYHSLWDAATIRSNRSASALTIAHRILAVKPRLVAVQVKTGVPWQWIGAIFVREADLNFRGAFANGDAVIGTGRKTYDVPANRGPFATWEESAIDEINRRGLPKIGLANWSVERMLFEAEAYNGWGYLGKCNSPYDWSFTTEYGPPEEKGGKYIRDRVFSYSAVDVQCGVAAMWKALATIDADTATLLGNRQVTPPKGVIEDAKKKATAGLRKTATAGGTVAAGGAAGSISKNAGADIQANHSILLAFIIVGVAVAAVAVSLTISTGNLLKARW